MSLKNLSVKTKIRKNLINKLKNKKINLIYRKFEKSLNINENFVVAVSGGPDSLALAYLSKVYSIKNGLKVKFLTVDHKLRPESTLEANLVKRILKKNFISSKILTWNSRKSIKITQSLARKKRLELLFAECDKLRIKNILLGHHLDDLFENFFIRLLRGSGLKGLISLDKKTKFKNKNLLRPLLDFQKKDLIFLSKKVFNFYVKDPTNEDNSYKRIRIRKLMSELQKDGLDKQKFLKTINNLKNSNTLIKFYVKKNIEKNSFYISKINKLILNKKFFQQPYEVIFRSIIELITLIGGRFYPPRGKKIDKIIKDIHNNRHIKVTLGGSIIEKVNQTVILSKEH
tara:strand:+ start:582 stop:1610 length:1029 start_codon:yes stop_codon:yes gene_type:complete